MLPQLSSTEPNSSNIMSYKGGIYSFHSPNYEYNHKDTKANHLYLTVISENSNALTHIKSGVWVCLPNDRGIQKMTETDMLHYLDSGSNATQRIIATTDPALNLPLIPEKWLKELYIPSNGDIKEVLVELEDKGHEDWIGDDVHGEPFWIENLQIYIKDKHCVIYSTDATQR